MTAAATVEDIIEALAADPLLLEALRARLLTRELLELPQTVAQLAASQSELAASQAELRDEVARLAAAQLESAAAQKEFAATQKEFAATQAEMRKDISRMFASQAHMWEEVSRIAQTLEDFMRSTNRRFETLTNDVAMLKGDHLEMRLQSRVHAMLGQRKRLRGIRIVNATFPAGLLPDFGDAIDSATDEGRITEDQRGRILSTDLIALARRQYSQEPVYVCFEAAFSLNADDTRRVLATGAALALVFPEAEIMNFIYGRSISERDRAQAESAGVDVVLDRSER